MAGESITCVRPLADSARETPNVTADEPERSIEAIPA
jgi:hypothetical protein